MLKYRSCREKEVERRIRVRMSERESSGNVYEEKKIFLLKICGGLRSTQIPNVKILEHLWQTKV